MLFEALNDEALARAGEALQKLQSIDFGDMTYFKKSTMLAMRDVNNALGGDGKKFTSMLGKLLGAARSKLKAVVNNPIPTALAYASALENAFKQAGQLIQHNIPQDVIRSMPSERLRSTVIKKLVGSNADSVQRAIAAAFKPSGTLTKIGVNWKRRYIDPDKAATAIMDAKLSDVIKALKSIRQGPQFADVTQDIDAAVATATQPTDDQTPAAKTTTNSNDEKQKQAAANDGSFDPDQYDDIASAIAAKTDIGSASVIKVMALLAKRGMLKQ
jgi:hypothetical protein